MQKLRLYNVFSVATNLPLRNVYKCGHFYQPILAKKIYDIYKFQIFKKITIFQNILIIRRLCLDCIRHFHRATSQGYIILKDIGNRLAS